MKKYFVSIVVLIMLISTSWVFAQAATNATQGMKLIDSTRGVTFSSPNAFWGINAAKHSISLNHNTHYDAHVTLKKSWYTVATAKEAYDKRKSSLKSYLPGAIFVKENDPITISGSVKGLSMIYKNPSDLKVIREILFIHKGQAYELVFQAKEENFAKVKEDFRYILQNMQLQ
jgi:hypothetical protein